MPGIVTLGKPDRLGRSSHWPTCSPTHTACTTAQRFGVKDTRLEDRLTENPAVFKSSFMRLQRVANAMPLSNRTALSSVEYSCNWRGSARCIRCSRPRGCGLCTLFANTVLERARLEQRPEHINLPSRHSLLLAYILFLTQRAAREILANSRNAQSAQRHDCFQLAAPVNGSVPKDSQAVCPILRRKSHSSSRMSMRTRQAHRRTSTRLTIIISIQ